MKLYTDIEQSKKSAKILPIESADVSWVGKSPAWTAEDIFKVQRICKYLDEAKKYYADITEVRECIDWLKSLKDRMELKKQKEN